MATDDQQVLVTGTAPAPATFRVPGNGQIQPKAIFAHYDGTSAATPFVPAIKVTSDGGELVAICPCPTSVAAAGSADVSWFPHVAFTPAQGATTGVIVDQFLVDSKTNAETSGSVVLTSGVQYLVTAQGTWSLWNSALEVGTPNANAIFPSSTAGRVSTQVGLDPECSFAFHDEHTGFTLGHETFFQFDPGSGLSYTTPQGGPYATPQPNYLYRYTITGTGAVLKAQIVELGAYADNYGKIQVTVYGLSGSGSGGGSGSLVPPDGADYSTLQVLAGVPLWEAAIDGGSA